MEHPDPVPTNVPGIAEAQGTGLLSRDTQATLTNVQCLGGTPVCLPHFLSVGTRECRGGGKPQRQKYV